MIEKIIEGSAKNKFLVFFMVGFLTAAGVWALRNTPLDAIPDGVIEGQEYLVDPGAL